MKLFNRVKEPTLQVSYEDVDEYDDLGPEFYSNLFDGSMIGIEKPLNVTLKANAPYMHIDELYCSL